MLISLAEYAKKYNRSPDNVRQKILRGGFETARKIGRNWVIDSEEPFIDERKVEMEKDRDYQFGKLLALLEKAETDALGDNSSRVNAMRSHYVNHPLATLAKIQKEILPDICVGLGPEESELLKDKIGEILSEIENPTNDELGANYLIGYYLAYKRLRDK